jgi:hypothetical protein
MRRMRGDIFSSFNVKEPLPPVTRMRVASFLAAGSGVVLLGRDDQAPVHDAHPHTGLRRETCLLQPQAAQPDPGRTWLGISMDGTV